MSPVTRLLPAPVVDVPLAGLYLDEELHRRRADGRAYVYTNFITSLDGRVAVGDDHGGHPRGVPPTLANARDWRLYEELALQADAVITSGRYVRDHAEGQAGPIFTFEDDPDLDDLRGWRQSAGLPPMPALAVVSRHLDFDVVGAAELAGEVIGIGSAVIDDRKLGQCADLGIAVVSGQSPDGVSGREIAEGLAELGHTTAFSSAGPHVAHLLLADGVMDAIYVTYVLRMLGGRSYVSVAEGELLEPPPSMQARSLFLDPNGADGETQLFASFEAS